MFKQNDLGEAFFVRSLRSGKVYGGYKVSAPLHFDYLQLVHLAAADPPLSSFGDLGPTPDSAQREDPLDLDDLVEPDPTGIDEDARPENALPHTETHPNPSPFPTTASTTPKAPQSKANSKRAQKRRKLKEQTRGEGPCFRQPTNARNRAYVLNQASTTPTALAAEEFAAAKGAHTAKMGSMKDQAKLRRIYELPSIHNLGLRRIRWDGVTPIAILDRFGRIIAVLCGRPQDDSYVEDLTRVFELFMEEGRREGLRAQAAPHRRGGFPAYNVGLLMGMGWPQPVFLDNKEKGPMLARLVAHPAVQRMAAYQESCFQLWAPRLYQKYANTMGALYDYHPSLLGPFNGVFSSAAFNFGGNVWAYKHRDFFNWPYGWCFITALGNFDANKGGQLILWELGLAIDFPHAATAAIPSAVITHSNIPVALGGQRCSFTQYSAGPIFRWVENGCRTEARFAREDPKAYAKMAGKKDSIYLERVKLFSTFDELFETVAQ